MFKLLLVTTEFPGVNKYGGAGVFNKGLYDGLRNIGVDIKVLVFVSNGDTSVVSDPNILVREVPNTKGRLSLIKSKFYQLFIIKRLARELRVDFVELSSSGSDSFYLLPLKISNLVMRTHGSITFVANSNGSNELTMSFNRRIQQLHEYLLGKNALAIAAVSRQYYKFFKDRLRGKVYLVENFVQKEFSSMSITSSGIDGPFVFYHGTIKEIKGTTELVKGFLDSRSCQNHKLVLAGKGSPTYIDGLIKADPNRILWLGEIEATMLKPLLRNSSLCIYPSYMDAFNLAVAEALSQAGLVLVSDVIDEAIVQEGVTGFRFPLSDKDRLSTYIDKVLDMDNIFIENVRNNARKHFVDNYCFEIGVQRNFDFYEGLLESLKHED